MSLDAHINSRKRSLELTTIGIFMTTVKKIAANTTIMLSGNVVVKVLALFVSVYLARYLGVEYYGEYNFVITYLTFFIFVANFGLDPILIRNLSRDSSNANCLTSNILIIRILTSLFSIILAILLIRLFGYPDETILYVSVLSSILLFQGVSYLFESVFHANLKMHYSAIGLIVSKLFFSAAAFVLIYLNKSLLDFLYVYIVAEMIRTGIAIYYSRNFVTIKFDINWGLWKSLFKECIPFIASYALFIIYYRVDILMLSKMEGNFAVGLYSSAYRLVDPILFIPAALASTLMPLMSKEYAHDLSKFKRLYSAGSKYILLLMLPLTIVLFLLSERIINILYTDDYFPAIITFQILSLTLVFNSVSSIQNSLLIAADRQKINTLSIGIGCVLNVVLNLILIPIYGYNGAAIATLISVIALFLIQLLFIKQTLSMLSLNRGSSGILISSFLIGVIIYSFPGMNLLTLVITCILSYILFLYLTKSVSKEEIDLMKLLLRKND
jgi:O-antigen/teichoic acid export membrane protein